MMRDAILPAMLVFPVGCGQPSLSDQALSLMDESPVFSRAAVLSPTFIARRIENGLDPNVRNGDSAADAFVTYAARNKATDTVQILLAQGADQDIRSSGFNNTPLFQAAFDGNLEIAWLPLDAGADVNVVDDLGNNALREAILGKRIRLVRLLLKAGCDPEQKNDEGMTMSEIASKDAKASIQELFETAE